MSEWIVAADAIVGTSPMELPERCVECGRTTEGGRRVHTTLYWYPRWIWVGVIWGVFPMVLLYFAARRRLEIGYSLCPDDVRSLRGRSRAAMGAWVLFLAFVIATVATHFNRFCMIAALVLFFVALIANMTARMPLTVAGHEDGVFGVKGLSRQFLLAAGKRGGTDTESWPQAGG